MIARLLISQTLDKRIEEIEKILSKAGLDRNHVDLLYFPSALKLGIEQARKIKEHFSLKPFQAKGRAVVLEDASNLTIEAQNALLKTLEEPPKEAFLILGASSDTKFLPTILSRCQIITFQPLKLEDKLEKDYLEIEKLLNSSIEKRFEYIAELEEREQFLKFLIQYFHSKLPKYLSFTKELLKAEELATQNVNIRAILEYLMLRLPNSGITKL